MPQNKGSGPPRPAKAARGGSKRRVTTSLQTLPVLVTNRLQLQCNGLCPCNTCDKVRPEAPPCSSSSMLTSGSEDLPVFTRTESPPLLVMNSHQQRNEPSNSPTVTAHWSTSRRLTHPAMATITPHHIDERLPRTNKVTLLRVHEASRKKHPQSHQGRGQPSSLRPAQYSCQPVMSMASHGHLDPAAQPFTVVQTRKQ